MHASGCPGGAALASPAPASRTTIPAASSSCRNLRQMQKAPLPPAGTPVGGESRGSYQRAGVWQIRACRRPKETRVASTGPYGPPRQSRRLLQFDGRALPFELLFDLFGFLLGHAFLHRAGRAFHQVLGLLEAQVGDRSDLLDDLDLLLSTTLQDDRELGLLLGRRRPRSGRRSAAARPRESRRGRRDGHAELLRTSRSARRARPPTDCRWLR